MNDIDDLRDTCNNLERRIETLTVLVRELQERARLDCPQDLHTPGFHKRLCDWCGIEIRGRGMEYTKE